MVGVDCERSLNKCNNIRLLPAIIHSSQGIQRHVNRNTKSNSKNDKKYLVHQIDPVRTFKI